MILEILLLIADNVGDNVGDVAGMGADLYESYAGSILATAALGVAAVAAKEHDNLLLQLRYLSAPMIIAGIGVILSIIRHLYGTHKRRCNHESS